MKLLLWIKKVLYEELILLRKFSIEVSPPEDITISFGSLYTEVDTVHFKSLKMNLVKHYCRILLQIEPILLEILRI